MVAALVQMDGAPVILAVAALGLVAYVVPHADVGGGPDVDIGVHILHALQFIGCDLSHVFRICPGHQSSLHIIVKDVDERLAACGVGLLYQGFHEGGLAAVQLNENLFTLLQADGTVDQKLCKFPDSGVFHVVSPFKAYRRQTGTEVSLCPVRFYDYLYKASRECASSACPAVSAETIRMAITEAGTATMAH